MSLLIQSLIFIFFSIKGFLILLCIFGLLNFFPLPYTACLGVFVLIDLIFFLTFCSNLSISFIDVIISLKNSSSICLFTSLSFNSLPFNSINYFSNSKGLFFTFKSCFFCIYFISIFLFLLFRFRSVLIYQQEKLEFFKNKYQVISNIFK